MERGLSARAKAHGSPTAAKAIRSRSVSIGGVAANHFSLYGRRRSMASSLKRMAGATFSPLFVSTHLVPTDCRPVFARHSLVGLYS